MRTAAGQDHMHHFRLALERLDDFGGIEHAVTDRVVDLVKNNEVPFTGLNGTLAFRPSFFDHADVFRIGLLGIIFYDATPHLHHNALTAERFHRVEYAVVPGAYNKLQH